LIEQLLKYDTEFFLFLNGLGNTSWDGFWLFVTEKWSSIPLYVFLLVLIYKQFGLKTTALILIAAALMITCTDQLGNFFKHGFKRPRPCQVAELDEFIRYVAKRCGRYGYFSAHAASSMATAVFVGLLLKSKYYYLPFFLLAWAVLIGYSRIYLGVHYPLDVITGMVIGGIFGWVFYKLLMRAKARWITA
jgi:undecaprenyl-diphosphatase